MPLVSLPGSPVVCFGPGHGINTSFNQPPAVLNTTLDATAEAVIYIGRVITSDGGSHTINTTGSSSIGWRTGAVTFANGGSTFSVGIAPVDAGAGPPARASNTTDIINFDVAAVFTGGGGGVTANAWQTSVPTTGTKTIANGDFVAIAFQHTVRAGADTVQQTSTDAGSSVNHAAVTSFVGGVYASLAATPNAVITFSDGALGWLLFSDVASTRTTTTFNSGSATKEYGELFNLPFPVKINGMYAFVDPDNDFDLVLYSAPLSGSPVAEKTISIDSNTVQSAAGRLVTTIFATPYELAASTDIAAVVKPGGANVSIYQKLFASASHSITEMSGTSSYGVSRASGAFADIASGTTHVYAGLIIGSFHDGTGSSGGGHVLGGTIVR